MKLCEDLAIGGVNSKISNLTAQIDRGNLYLTHKVCAIDCLPAEQNKNHVKMLVDEDFDNTIVRGLFRRNLILDMVRVQDIGLSGKDDPTILEWAAQEGRVLLTHDVATITRYAYERSNPVEPSPINLPLTLPNGLWLVAAKPRRMPSQKIVLCIM